MEIAKHVVNLNIIYILVQLLRISVNVLKKLYQIVNIMIIKIILNVNLAKIITYITQHKIHVCFLVILLVPNAIPQTQKYA